MSDVKVEKQTSAARRDAPGSTPGIIPSNDLFAPMFPVGRFFGMSPFAMMREFTEEMDRMFNKSEQTPAWAPAVDIQRCDGSLVVTAELPGLKKEEVKVEVTDNAVVIEGERKREHSEDHKGFHRFERSYGKFYRTIPLPEGAKTDQAKAELNDGILRISVPAGSEARGAANSRSGGKLSKGRITEPDGAAARLRLRHWFTL